MTFRLHMQVVDPSPQASRATAVVLHGILGSGQNFRSFALELAKRRDDYRFVLADLRHHGKSRGAPPPDTLEACADDVLALFERLRAESKDAPPRALIGHSFGGKVALEVSRKVSPQAGLGQCWVLDSNPGRQETDGGSEIRGVIRAVEAIEMPLEKRKDVLAPLERQGLSVGLRNWMTTNLERRDDRYFWTFDLERIKALLTDYETRDLWDHLETRSNDALELHFVVAERSERLDGPIRERLNRLASEHRLDYHLLERAGHWLHVDNGPGLLEIMAPRLLRA